MSVAPIGNLAFVPLTAEARPPHAEAGDGRTEDVTGSRARDDDGGRRVVLARGGEAQGGDDRGRDERSGPTTGRAEGGAAGAGRTDGTEQARSAEGEDEETPPGELTTDEQREVKELQARDREVRAHEMAHVAAGGAHVTSGPTYSFQQGPDGRRYAIGGEVGIDTSPEDDPQATIMKMMQVRAAALAPAEPSGADRAVAAAAAQTAAQARAELAAERTEGDDEEGRAEGVTEAAGRSEPSDGSSTGTSAGPDSTDAPASGIESSSASVPAATEVAASAVDDDAAASAVDQAVEAVVGAATAPASATAAVAGTIAPPPEGDTAPGAADGNAGTGNVADRARARYGEIAAAGMATSTVSVAA